MKPDPDFAEIAALWTIGLLLALFGLCWLGFAAILLRLRPRVIYLHQNSDFVEKTGTSPEKRVETPESPLKSPLPSR